jgi:UDP-N-acetylglucosamine 2-epimerase (non-hydrolysing)
MPEEHNRVILDHICELLFAPTDVSARNLVNDNVRGEIHIVGNTIADAVFENLKIARKKRFPLIGLNLDSNEYCICTTHREENVDVYERLEGILKGLAFVGEELKKTILFPLHPRTRKRISQFGLDGLANKSAYVKLLEPFGYLDFLIVLSQAALVLTDSGGLQEESCILKVPCVTLRDNTERPETVKVGANVLSGTEPDRILKNASTMLSSSRTWPDTFGKAAVQIVDITIEAMAKGVSLTDALAKF